MEGMAEDLRCSDAARERQDPMVGTAPPQPRLLLVEQDAGWGTDALTSLQVPDDVRAELGERAAAAGARVMLIRRPGRHASSVCYLRAWCVVDPAAPEGHRVTWGTWAYPTELFAAVERAEELAGLASGGAQDTLSTPPGDDATVLLVCTNGRKDVCCALRGRPVATALAQRFPEQTWECTHTGGDRFAANVLVLPDGATYGGLDTDTALAAVDGHRAGDLAIAHLRGVVGQPRPVQAAVVGALDELGLTWGAVRPVGVDLLEHLTHAQVEAEGDELARDATVVARWSVRLRTVAGEELQVAVSEHLRPATALTCQAKAPKFSRVPVYEGRSPTIAG